MSKIKLTKKILLTGTIQAQTGLLIGGSNTALGIGGPDKMVIRNPISNEPYIPGSSLKGKMRSLLELAYGYIKESDTGTVKYIGSDDNENHISAALYGTAKSGKEEERKKQRPSRIIVRDCILLNGETFKNKTDLPFTESKIEVVIDRITSAAMPRTFERVPAGAEFGFNIVLNIFEGDKFPETELVEATFKSLQLLQDDYLGGSGSRGSGQVKIHIESIKERTSAFYTSGAEENEYTAVTIPDDLKAMATA